MTYDRSAALENLKSRHVGAPPPRIPAEFEIVPDPDAVEAPDVHHDSDHDEGSGDESAGPEAPQVAPNVIQIGPEHDGLYALRAVPPLREVALQVDEPAGEKAPSAASAKSLASASPAVTGAASPLEDAAPSSDAERLPGWARKSGQRQLVCDLSLEADAALTRGRTTGERNADTLVRALAMTADELVSHFIEEKTKPLSRGFVLVTPHKRPPRAQQTRRVTFQLSPQNAQALQALAAECSTENLTKVVETALMLAFPATQKPRPT
jgi:hypothetical protein